MWHSLIRYIWNPKRFATQKPQDSKTLLVSFISSVWMPVIRTEKLPPFLGIWRNIWPKISRDCFTHTYILCYLGTSYEYFCMSLMRGYNYLKVREKTKWVKEEIWVKWVKEGKWGKQNMSKMQKKKYE